MSDRVCGPLVSVGLWCQTQSIAITEGGKRGEGKGDFTEVGCSSAVEHAHRR